MVFLFEFVAFLIVLIVPGYLLVNKYFSGFEKVVLSVFLSLSVTSFVFFVVVSFFRISKEFIYLYALLLLVLLFFVKRLTIKEIIQSIKRFKLTHCTIESKNLVQLLSLFTLTLFLSLTAFFIPINQTIVYDDETYHLPVIYDVAEDGQKTFFSETHNIYQVRSNQFPLLFEFFVGTTKFFLGDFFYWFVSFFALVLCLFLIYFISKEAGRNQIFSSVLFGLSPVVFLYSRFFTGDYFVSLFFLGCVFFVLRFLRTEDLFFVGVASFLSGLMFLTKFTGGIFFVGLLLFLLYKKKFKGAGIFVLVFVLVSLVFFVSHFGVPVEQVSVGDYGSISSNPLDQIPSNIYAIGEILFIFFSKRFYIFFVPFLFFLGLFWRNKKEADFFSLFFISLIFFLLLFFINAAAPTQTGFPRYFLPLYALLCIFAGIQLKKFFLLKDKRIVFFFSLLFILLLLFNSLPFLKIFITETNLSSSYSPFDKIENSSDVSVWFVDGAAAKLELDKAVLYDYVWRADFSGDPCDFLKENKINYLVYYNFFPSQKDYLGEFELKLKKELKENNCSELVYEKNLEIYKIKN